MPEVTYRKLLSEFKAAMLAVATGQSYAINGRTLTRANLAEIQKTIDWLELKVVREIEPAADNSGVVLVVSGEQS